MIFWILAILAIIFVWFLFGILARYLCTFSALEPNDAEQHLIVIVLGFVSFVIVIIYAIFLFINVLFQPWLRTHDWFHRKYKKRFADTTKHCSPHGLWSRLNI